MPVRWFLGLLCATTPVCHAQIYAGSLPTSHPAIRYLEAPVDDPVARLSQKIDAGRVRLEFREGGLGYLPSLLEHLGVNPDSQALVFSKTSFQGTRISPRNPRAIYFNDDVAIGFVPGGEGMELAALDSRQGVIFYTLDNRRSDRHSFVRQDVCLNMSPGPFYSRRPWHICWLCFSECPR